MVEVLLQLEKVSSGLDASLAKNETIISRFAQTLRLTTTFCPQVAALSFMSTIVDNEFTLNSFSKAISP
jgi:hypothetical protein